MGLISGRWVDGSGVDTDRNMPFSRQKRGTAENPRWVRYYFVSYWNGHVFNFHSFSDGSLWKANRLRRNRRIPRRLEQMVGLVFALLWLRIDCVDEKLVKNRGEMRKVMWTTWQYFLIKIWCESCEILLVRKRPADNESSAKEEAWALKDVVFVDEGKSQDVGIVEIVRFLFRFYIHSYFSNDRNAVLSYSRLQPLKLCSKWNAHSFHPFFWPTINLENKKDILSYIKEAKELKLSNGSSKIH